MEVKAWEGQYISQLRWVQKGQGGRSAWKQLPPLAGNKVFCPFHTSTGAPSPDSRVTGLGDEGAQLLDSVINVESPATLNFGGKKREERVEESAVGPREKRKYWGSGERAPKEG